MKLIQQIDEARYHLQDEMWFHSATSIADYNMRNAKRDTTSKAHEMEELIYWQDYKDWLKDYKKELVTVYRAFKNDRDTYLNHLEQAGMDKLRYAEVWSDHIDPSEYRQYIDFNSQTKDDPRPEPARQDYLQYVTNTMIDILTHPQSLNEAKYATRGDGEWRDVLELVDQYMAGDSLRDFVRANEKILKQLFKTVKGSFRMFHDMTEFYMDDAPEEYDESDRDPQKIAAQWWDMFPQDLDEDPLWKQASAKLGGPLFGDTMQVFGDYIIYNAKRIADFDQIYEATYSQRHVDRLTSYHKWSDTEGSHRVLKNPKVKHKGTGAFASTYQHQDRPHDVTKITKPMEFPDGYQKYLRMLLQHDDRDNPYFPKVREVRERRKGEANTLAVKMEALQHIETLSHKEANAILDKWLGKNKQHFIDAGTRSHWMGGEIPRMSGDDYYGPAIVKVLRDLFNYHEGLVVDKNLAKAMKFIKYKVAVNGVDLDLGDNNVMLRRTPYGVQVVFTDPVA